MDVPSQRPPASRSPRRTKAERTEFYERAVRTSLQLFAEGGYEAISMRRLAAEVGVPPMSLYRYFPTKLYLIRHIWTAVLERAQAQGERKRRGAATPGEQLRAFLDGYIQYWLDHRAHYWAVFGVCDHAARDPCDVANPLATSLERTTATLEGLVDACTAATPATRAERHDATHLVTCKLLGFLYTTIGLATPRWRDVASLKHKMLDDIVATLPAATARVGAARRAPAR